METVDHKNTNTSLPGGGESLCLRMLDGPKAGEIWAITTQPLLVGRGIGCQVRIDNPWVSRVHCELRIKDGAPWIFNYSQRNPTFVNGVSTMRASLQVGDVIELPETRLTIGHPVEAVNQQTLITDPSETTRTFTQMPCACRMAQTDACLREPGRVCESQALFQFLRELGKAPTLDAIIDQIREHLRERLDAETCWVARRVSTEGDVTLFQPSTARENSCAPHGALQHVCAASAGFHAASRSNKVPRHIIAAPLIHDNSAFGAIALERPAERKDFSGAELDYLLVAAESAAPLIRAAQRMAQIQIDQKATNTHSPAEQPLVGQDAATETLRLEIQTAATARLNIMLLGETGVGKALAARMLHEQSARSNGPFIAVNCGAIPGELFESEMFGYEPGVSTAAVTRRKGYFELAHGGTLFLDEIGDLDIANQAHLLRATETRHFRRLGGEEEIHADVRIVCATTNPILDDGDAGLRPDLFHRLAGALITIPPLRDRAEDIPELALHFLAVCAPHARAHPRTFTSRVMDRMMKYPWPGNIRELKNVIEAAAYMAESPTITEISLPDPDVLSEAISPSVDAAMDDLERRYLTQVLEGHQGLVKEAAAAIGMPKSTLYYKLARLGIRTKL